MDSQHTIVEQVREALRVKQAVRIHGGCSKDFYGNEPAGLPLDVSTHRGIIEYDPAELVLTCRAGSRLDDIRGELARQGQHLPFEPPGFGASATIGGTVACGFSGPRRPWSGSLRDYLLGVKLVNGNGEVVRFGGQVMKNVAGYDISRLVAGSLGTLGVILETSFKVLPLPAAERTLSWACGQDEAIQRINQWAGKPLPLSGASWHDGMLMVRLSGTASETRRAAVLLEPDETLDETTYWLDLREHRLDFFSDSSGRPQDLWRLSLPPATPALDIDGDCLLDWGGAQRWCRCDLAATELRTMAASNGGHATLFRGSPGTERFHPLPGPMAQLQKRVKQAMDPNGLFNPGRMYPGW